MVDGIIYGLSLDGHTIRYVGLTVSAPRIRLYSHRYDAKRGMTRPLHYWIRKHGPDNVILTTLATAPVDALKELEKSWIAHLRGLGFDLLNLTDGGEGCHGRVMSPETRKKISEANRGRLKGKKSNRVYGPLSEAQREKMSTALRGRVGHWSGKKLSDEHRRKISEAGLGRTSPQNGKKLSQERKDAIGAQSRKSWAARKAEKSSN